MEQAYGTHSEVEFVRTLTPRALAHYARTMEKRKRWGSIDQYTIKREVQRLLIEKAARDE